MLEKKIVDLNDKKIIRELSRCIQNIRGIKREMVEPLQEGIQVLETYEENHNLSVSQIQKIYEELNINEKMTPEQMDQSLGKESKNVAIIEKKYLKTSIDREEFSILIETILRHFSTSVDFTILQALTKIIENFSCICLTSREEFKYKDVCFKFFSKNPEHDHILVLVLNIHYHQFSTKHKLLNFCRYKKQLLNLNFLGALVKTNVPLITLQIKRDEEVKQE